MKSESQIPMKLSILLSIFALTLVAKGVEKPAPRFRDAVTHDQLALRLREAAQNDPMKGMIPTTGEDPSKANRPVNLLEQSDIICFNGLATLVPKRAILAAPAKHKKSLSLEPGARIVGWLDFYTANRGWITTVEVSRSQAEGNMPIAEEIQNRIGKSANLVVATYKGGPISVLPLKEPAANKETASRKP